MLSGDPEDDWTRFRGKLHERRNELISEIIGGGLDTAQYENRCGRVSEIDDTLELMKAVRRGEDLRPPVRDPLKHVEE